MKAINLLRKTLKGLQDDFERADEPADRGHLGRAVAILNAEIRREELHEQKLRPEAKTPEEHEVRIRFHFEALPKPRQVEVAKALLQIAGDGLLFGR